ncbi:outer membrane beta-barrel protein [uncultured Salinisphaera sp.]|uniref:outer membrane beta-barrel protein n=1 Tax=uncultured Salinisphaera sp. TaxID=359372 RepID=UPI0032B23CCA
MRPIELRYMLAASLVALPCGAYPGELRLSPYVETGISRDSNLFASSEDSREADTQRRATVGADARWGMSRQQLSLHVDLSELSYVKNERLDHSAYKGNFVWNYEVGHALRGRVYYNRSRQLTDFENRSTREQDFIRLANPGIETTLVVTPHWHVVGGVDYRTRQHTLDSERRYDRDELESRLALRFIGSPQASLTAGVERIDGRYPERDPNDPLARRFVQHEPFGRLDWQVSGLSRIQLRAGYAHRDNRGGQSEDYSAPTARLSYIRDVSAKTQLRFTLSQDIYSADNIDANALRNRGAEVALDWEYGPAIELTARGAWNRRDYQQTSVADDTRQDEVRNYGLDLTWRPRPQLALIATGERVIRDSSEPAFDYREWIGGIAVRITLDPLPQ